MSKLDKVWFKSLTNLAQAQITATFISFQQFSLAEQIAVPIYPGMKRAWGYQNWAASESKGLLVEIWFAAYNQNMEQ